MKKKRKRVYTDAERAALAERDRYRVWTEEQRKRKREASRRWYARVRCTDAYRARKAAQARKDRARKKENGTQKGN